jgi:hypothetical protein
VLRTDTDGSVAVTIEADGTIAVGTSGARVAAAARPVVGPEIAGLDPLPVPLLRGPAGEFSCGIPSGE